MVLYVFPKRKFGNFFFKNSKTIFEAETKREDENDEKQEKRTKKLNILLQVKNFGLECFLGNKINLKPKKSNAVHWFWLQTNIEPSSLLEG